MFNTLSRGNLKEILIRQENDEVVMEMEDFNFRKSYSTPLRSFEAVAQKVTFEFDGTVHYSRN